MDPARLREEWLKLAYELQPHQQRVVDRMNYVDALMLVHGLGSGKTLSALAVADAMDAPVTVISPAAIKAQFEREKLKHGIDTEINQFTYNKLPESVEGLLVYDEAHRMGRLESQMSRIPENIHGDKTLLLTGTPMRNEPHELIPLLRALGVNISRDPRAFNERFVREKRVNPPLLAAIFSNAKPGISRSIKNEKELRTLLKGRVDYYRGHSDEMPDVDEERIEVTMTPVQQRAYDAALRSDPGLAYKIRHGIPPSKTESKRLNAFLQASRQISNTPAYMMARGYGPEDEPKLNRAFEEIVSRYKSDSNYRGVTFSQYLDSGVYPMAKRLKKAGIPYGIYTGGMTDTERRKVLDKYNRGEIKHLLISRAGGEGLDLKGTKLMQVLEPHWNENTIQQAIGRAVRYQSHQHLPEEERRVAVQRYVAIPRNEVIRRWLGLKPHQGADQYLEMTSKRKQELIDQFMRAIAVASEEGKPSVEGQR